MRIATMVKGYLTVPTPADIVYAPADLALQISNGLIERGHTVDFYAPKGSVTGKAKLITQGLEPLANSYEDFQNLLVNGDYTSDNILPTWDYYLAEEMFTRASKGDYDILLFHHPEVALPFVRQFPNVRVVYIMHDPISPLQQTMLEMYKTKNQHLISISKKQQESAPTLPYLKTIYNGIDINLFIPGTGKKDDYLLFLGSVLPRKGTKEAVEVALRSKKRLIIAGPTYPASQEYFNTYIKPFVDDKQIIYLGHLPHDKTPELFQKAAAFLMPIQWEEPFGLTMAEALACGTPVLAFNRGSVPEIVENGKTGFITSNVEEMAASVSRLLTLSPDDCRASAVKRFSINAMVEGYEKAFLELLK